MDIVSVKVIQKCPDCWMGIGDSCRTCDGTRQIEKEIDFPSFVYQLTQHEVFAEHFKQRLG